MTARAARPYTILSIGAAIATMVIKLAAYQVTGSVGLLSDALESTVNLLAAIVAFWALSVAAMPPDVDHPYGHTKAEYFSSGLESAFILIAALSIIGTALERFFNPQPLTQIDLGVILALVATAINGGVARTLLQAGKRLNSIVLTADAHHLLTDVWTSLGVVLAVGLIRVTGWEWLDPVIAIIVGLNIIWTGIRLLKETLSGLMDQALPSEQLQQITALFLPYEADGIRFHLLRTRQSGSQSFVSFHVLVPGDWTVQRGHDLCESLEAAIADQIMGAQVTTHLEPIEDPKSWEHPDFAVPVHPPELPPSPTVK